MHWKVKFDIRGGHVHCSLFCAPEKNQTYAKCGDFVVRTDAEFASLTQAFAGADFIENDPNRGIVQATN